MILIIGAGTQELRKYLDALDTKICDAIGKRFVKTNTNGMGDAMGFHASIDEFTNKIAIYFDEYIFDIKNTDNYTRFFMRKLPHHSIFTITDKQDIADNLPPRSTWFVKRPTVDTENILTLPITYEDIFEPEDREADNDDDY